MVLVNSTMNDRTNEAMWLNTRLVIMEIIMFGSEM